MGTKTTGSYTQSLTLGSSVEKVKSKQHGLAVGCCTKSEKDFSRVIIYLEGRMNEVVPITIVVKFSDGNISDHVLQVDNVIELTVTELRNDIRKAVGGKTVNRRLRLIYGGKVLNDQTNLAKELAGRVALNEEGVAIHEVVPNRKVFVHCAIGDILTSTELEHESEYDRRIPTRSTLPELRGFDRLRNSGFTDDDIIQLRQQFGRIHGYGGINNLDNNSNNAGTGSTINEELAQMEDQWIDSGANDTIGDGNIMGGDYLDDMLGILLGMFLGVFVILIIKEPAVISRRQQRPLLSGALFNIVFAILRRLG